MSATTTRPPLLVRGDLDGFFGLALDNLVQLLLVDALCRGVLGFPAALVYGRILPGAAVSILLGNLFYAWQARRLAARTGRADVCALPYGINTVSLFGHVFLVMLPAKLAAEAAGHPGPATAAWQAGLLACLGSAVIEGGGAFVAERIRRATPRAATTVAATPRAATRRARPPSSSSTCSAGSATSAPVAPSRPSSTYPRGWCWPCATSPTPTGWPTR